MKHSPSSSFRGMAHLSAEALQQVAAYFQVLSDPTRLMLLNHLRQGECNVGELAQRCQCSAANVSRHLSQLMRHGLVARETRGTSAYFRMADASVDALCDLVCGSLARRFEQQARSGAVFVRTHPAPSPHESE